MSIRVNLPPISRSSLSTARISLAFSSASRLAASILASTASSWAIDLLVQLLLLRGLRGLELGVLDLVEVALDLLPGRRWSAMIIQTMASVIAIEVIAKTTCKVGWLR